MPKMNTEKSSQIGVIEKKYLNRLYNNTNLGFNFCQIDKEDLAEVRKVFTVGMGYIISKSGKYLGWD